MKKQLFEVLKRYSEEKSRAIWNYSVVKKSIQLFPIIERQANNHIYFLSAFDSDLLNLPLYNIYYAVRALCTFKRDASCFENNKVGLCVYYSFFSVQPVSIVYFMVYVSYTNNNLYYKTAWAKSSTLRGYMQGEKKIILIQASHF